MPKSGLTHPPDPSGLIEWPPALGLPASLPPLSWGMTVAELGSEGVRIDLTRSPLLRARLAEPFSLQGLPLTATLLFELDRLVRIELTGRLDGPALSALGAGAETLDDLAHHRLECGRTRVEIDALDHVIALEPDEDLSP